MEEYHNTEMDEPFRERQGTCLLISDHITRWRDHRDANYMDKWLEYERIFRGIWDANDRNRDSNALASFLQPPNKP